MAFLFRWLMRVFVVMAVLVIAISSLLYYFSVRSLPDYNASFDLPNIEAPVEIIRDTYNVPHILGENDRDVYFGLGFAHAQDRLWQMTMLRRTAQGRLSEIFGERTIDIDEFIRRLDLYALSQASFVGQTKTTKSALIAYANGVNAWIRTVNEQALGRGAPEFFAFSNNISPWVPSDSLAILRLLAVQNDTNLQNEITRAQMLLTVGPELINDIMPESPGNGTMALPDISAYFNGTPMKSKIAEYKSDPLDPIKQNGMGGASNAWAASASRSVTNAPLLATDPHTGLSAPSIWMLAHIELNSGGVIGATIPGIPAILSGRSSNLAWGATSAYTDNLDIYIEQLNPENPDEYLTPMGYKPFTKKSVIINVKESDARVIELKYTENGPVMPANHQSLGSITPEGHVTSLKWAVLEPHDLSMSGTIELMSAKSIIQARNALKKVSALSQNFVLADKSSIALQTAGKIPKRQVGHSSQGRIPSQGWIPTNRWAGYFDFSDNPYILNPESGIVANTNNKLTNAPFPKHVSFNWGDTQRINRLTKLLNSRKVHTHESFTEAQIDTVSYTARSLLPLIARELWFSGNKAATGTPERRQQIALDLLASWNGEMNQHLPEPLIYAAWLRNLQRRLASDELGPLIDRFPRPDPIFIERVYRDINNASQWCDIRLSSRIETCVDIARMALEDALTELTEKYGPRIDSWRWGQAHRAYQDHEVLGKVAFINWFTNIRQDTAGGDNTLMRARTSGQGATPYANIHAASYRAVVDFADLDSSVFIISTGQSGHPLSPHYDDLARLWRRGEYIPMSLDPELARGGAVGVTVLQPQ